MRRLRRFYWKRARRHSGEICQRCGTAVIKTATTYWRAPNDMWLVVYDTRAGVRCMRCFGIEADAMGVPFHWEARWFV